MGQLPIPDLRLRLVKEIGYRDEVDHIGFIYTVIESLFCLALHIKAPGNILEAIILEKVSGRFYEHDPSEAIGKLVFQDLAVGRRCDLHCSIGYAHKLVFQDPVIFSRADI